MPNGRPHDMSKGSEVQSAASNSIGTGSQGSEMLSSMLAAASPDQQKQILGEHLYPLVQKHKVTIVESGISLKLQVFIIHRWIKINLKFKFSLFAFSSHFSLKLFKKKKCFFQRNCAFDTNENPKSFCVAWSCCKDNGNAFRDGQLGTTPVTGIPWVTGCQSGRSGAGAQALQN